MLFLQTRIFVHPSTLTNQWYESLLGRVVRPLVNNHPELLHYWFSMYVCNDEEQDIEDCDFTKVPADYFFDHKNITKWHASIRFRFALQPEHVEAFKRDAEELIKAEKCLITDWREFDRLADLGNDKHIAEVPNGDPKREERAILINDFYHSLAKVILHSLVEEPDGSWRFERSNPWATFERVVHVTHNMTHTATIEKTIRIDVNNEAQHSFPVLFKF